MTESSREKCVKFEFDSIHAAYERNMSSSGDKYFKKLNTKTYLIQFYVKPGNAFFESTVKSSGNKKNLKLLQIFLELINMEINRIVYKIHF